MDLDGAVKTRIFFFICDIGILSQNSLFICLGVSAHLFRFHYDLGLLLHQAGDGLNISYMENKKIWF